jgi:hypothetical protein
MPGVAPVTLGAGARTLERARPPRFLELPNAPMQIHRPRRRMRCRPHTGGGQRRCPRNPTCTFDAYSHLVTVHDKSDIEELTLVRDGLDIAAHNASGATVKCYSITQQGVKATILNTDAISVIGTLVDIPTGGCATCPPQPINDGYVVDETEARSGPGSPRRPTGSPRSRSRTAAPTSHSSR